MRAILEAGVNELSRVEIGGAVAISVTHYRKWGQENALLPVDLDALVAEGEPQFVELWVNPGDKELELRELRKEREALAEIRKEAGKGGFGEGAIFRATFVLGKNPKRDTDQWEATSKGVKLVVNSWNDPQPETGKYYFVRVTRVLVQGRVLLVEIEVEDDASLSTKVANLERETTPKPAPEPTPIASSSAPAGGFNNPFAGLGGMFGRKG